MSRVSVTMNKPENDRKTLMARGIVVMLLLSTLVQILSQTLIDNPDDISESMEPTEQTQSMYAQSYDVGNQSRGGYHLVTGDWWEPPLYVPSTSDWDADGFENANDSHPLNPAIPLPGTSPCQSGSPCGEDYAFSAMNPIPNDKKADSMDALVVGDIDGDGDYDAITGGYNKIQLFLNENGVISETATWSGSFSSSNYVDTLALADVDMDGDLDIAGALSNRVKIIENVGGTFATNTLLWTSPSDISVGDIAFGDLDSDGDLDLVIGISSGENEIFSNDGTGDFGTSATWTATNSTDTNTVALADFDIDGDIDMLIGGGTSDYSSSGDGNELFVNNGGFNTTSDWKGTDGHNTKMAEFADLNGDGYLDLFFANFGDPLQIYLYDAGTFPTSADWESTFSNRTFDAAIGDIDSDGDLDIATYLSDTADSGKNQIYLNKGGQITDEPIWYSNDAAWNTRSGALVDINNDGKLDMITTNHNSGAKMRTYLNTVSVIDSNPVWTGTNAYETKAVSLNDVDGDGDIDRVVTENGKLYYYENDGTGPESSTYSNSDDWNYSGTFEDIELGDVDNDGDLDLIAVKDGVNVMFKFASGSFSTSADWSSGDSKDSNSIALADVDNDGNLDLAVGNDGEADQIFMGTGTTFSTSANWSQSGATSTTDIGFGDVDGDGDLDLAMSNDRGSNLMYFNHGGSFNTSSDWSGPYFDQRTFSMAWGDVNNDGFSDLAFGNNGWSTNEAHYSYSLTEVYLSDGTGLSTNPDWKSSDERVTTDLAWADLDGDGDLELIAVSGQGNKGQMNSIYLNVDNSLYSEAFWNSSDLFRTNHVEVADLNGDGLNDLFFGNYGDSDVESSEYYGLNQIIISVVDDDGDWISNDNDDISDDPTQSDDADGDGHGDNSQGLKPDSCTGYWGDSWRDRWGCPDEDGDGQSNLNDDFWRKDTQWVDTDGDGRGDNWGNSSWDAGRSGAWPGQYMANAYLQDPYPLDYDNDGFEESALSGAVAPFDNCPFVYGLSTEDVNGCPDSDGDGYSDLSDSHSGDQTQWSDTDNDGYGDNWGDGAWNQSRAGGLGQWVQSASSPDNCPTIWGSSTMDYYGCTDNDGDGYSSLTDVDDNDGNDWNDADNDGFGDNADQCPFSWGNITSPSDKGCPDTDADGHADRSDDLPNDATQWADSDDDGYGDNIAGNTPDACKDERGTSTRGVSAGVNTTKYGCADSDSDGYANTDDLCPFSYGNSWVDRFACPDSDQDGISDNVDPYPNNATSDIEDWDDDGYLDHSSDSNTDAFPTDNTQNSDTDGDGHGDNANGNSGDQFYTQPTQWQDADGDGYGDNQAPGAFEPDRCPSTNGTSTTDRFGCTDTDGDGFSDSTPGYFAHPQGQADSHPNNVSQYRDKDGDGYGDNPTGEYPDSCDNNHGTSTRRISPSGANQTWYGCPDADGDSYEDDSDPCKNQFGNSWVDQFACPDSDQDGISDEADPYPNTATSDTNDWDDDGVININDAFPADRTQSQDTDGDGFGDDSTGSNPDAFVNEISQWSDLDGDGYGDNPIGVDADDCSYTAGNSTRDRLGCPDNDGDGWSNPDGAWNSAYGADAFIDDATQWRDQDDDGYGDNVNGSDPDDCSMQAGTSTMKIVNGANITWLGCIDTDGDGYHDASDPCPFQFGNSWVDRMGCPDSDQDGISDGNDPYPEDATSSIDDYDGDGVANDMDDFPADRTQSQDADGDGYGDDPNGDSPDKFPDESTQWQDSDNDGYGDNFEGVEPDECIYEAGNSTDPVYGCIDTDGDGAADDYDDFPRDPTQQLDSDGDGYGDDGDTNQTDDCPYEMGDSTLGKIGCPDSDGDGWADIDDECPDQYGNSGEPFTGCLDRDGDNVADIVDIFPDDSNESTDFDGDGIGDASDIYPFDFDNDNVTTELDWDDTDPNEQVDSDNDGVGDNADVWPMQSEIWSDVDGDGWADQFGHLLTDDCPSIPGTSTKFMHGCSDIDFDGMPDLLDPDIDGDGITNDNEMDASTKDIEYDPFDNQSTPSDMDGDGIPDKMDKDTDGDGFPNELEKERGSDHNDGTKTPFNQYGDQDTGLFYIPGEGFKSKYDPNGVEISVSAMLDMLTSEYLLPLLMIPITIFALLRKGRRYKKMRKTIENCEDPDILSEYEEGIDRVIMKKKVKVEHGMLLRNLFERKRDAFDSKKSIPKLKQSGAGGGRNEPQQGPQGPSPGPRRHRPSGGQQERKW